MRGSSVVHPSFSAAASHSSHYVQAERDESLTRFDRFATVAVGACGAILLSCFGMPKLVPFESARRIEYVGSGKAGRHLEVPCEVDDG